jgi:mannose-6-phosphate isomerase-like protein (cupin superfamily)
MTKVEDGMAMIVPAGARHNVKNTGDKPLKLYTLYAPPEHIDGIVHATKSNASASREHFDGKTTE